MLEETKTSRFNHKHFSCALCTGDLLMMFMFQCQVVLQGKSRNLIIRELQRTVS